MPHSKTPTDILLSLSTVPLLAILLGSKALSVFLKEIGEASEELFRGDRLPVLKIHPSEEGQKPDSLTE